MACVWAPPVGGVALSDAGISRVIRRDDASGVGLGGVAVGERPGLVESAGERRGGMWVCGG